jgi:hypothetical protein
MRSEELHCVYSKLNIIWLSKWKRMCCTGEEEMCMLGCGWKARRIGTAGRLNVD